MYKLNYHYVLLCCKIIDSTFTEIDTNIHTTGVFSDQEIVDLVLPTPKSDSDEYKEVKYSLIVSIIKVKASLDKVSVH